MAQGFSPACEAGARMTGPPAKAIAARVDSCNSQHPAQTGNVAMIRRATPAITIHAAGEASRDPTDADRASSTRRRECVSAGAGRIPSGAESKCCARRASDHPVSKRKI